MRWMALKEWSLAATTGVSLPSRHALMTPFFLASTYRRPSGVSTVTAFLFSVMMWVYIGFPRFPFDNRSHDVSEALAP